jgi:hypothetical protein
MEDRIAEPQPPGLLAPEAAHLHDVVALTIRIQKNRNRFGRILEVAIDQHRDVPRNLIQSGRAVWWPKLRERATTTSRGSDAAAPSSHSRVRSELPSSPKTISCAPPGIELSTALVRRTSSATAASSF